MAKRGFRPVSFPTHSAHPMLPLRATKTSAGYDFFAPCDIVIPPQKKAVFATDVKAKMGENEVLLLVVRSSAGMKRDLMVANTVGVIDSDYYNNADNEGNIHIALRNLRPAMELLGYRRVVLASGETVEIPVIKDLNEENTVVIRAGERVVQGVFLPVLFADSGDSDTTRSGGLGSSGT
ncbi:MAG: dUTP diphosphatase [Christensenellales bacterium]|jgi:dUTP pyrophosphatase